MTPNLGDPPPAIGQNADDGSGCELAIDPDRQAFERELVEHNQLTVLTPPMGAVLDKVIGPNVIGRSAVPV